MIGQTSKKVLLVTRCRMVGRNKNESKRGDDLRGKSWTLNPYSSLIGLDTLITCALLSFFGKSWRIVSLVSVGIASFVPFFDQ